MRLIRFFRAAPEDGLYLLPIRIKRGTSVPTLLLHVTPTCLSLCRSTLKCFRKDFISFAHTPPPLLTVPLLELNFVITGV